MNAPADCLEPANRPMSPSPSSSSTASAANARENRARLPWADLATLVPQALRSLVRADEIWLVVLAAGVGLGSGLVVVAMSLATQMMHHVLFAHGTAIDALRAEGVKNLGIVTNLEKSEAASESAEAADAAKAPAPAPQKSCCVIL